jgi:phenylacetaldehyde dehydrogenase
MWIRNSNDGDRIAPQRGADDASIDRAIGTAAAIHETGQWSGVPAVARADALDSIAARIDALADSLSLADAITTGVVISLTDRLAKIVPHTFRAAAALLREGGAATTLPGPFGDVDVLSVPLGPAAVIAPWNAPAVIAAHKVASALAAGCPVILKPSEHAPLSCHLLACAIADSDLPTGAFQLVLGGRKVGAALVSDPRVRAVSFTGGLAGGRCVAAACANDMKPAQLELGGNNPLIILDDADIGAAADGVVTGLTTMNGQWCRAVGRILVHESITGALVAALEPRLAAIRMGSSLDRDSEMGPLAHAGHHRSVASAVDALCARGGTALRYTRVPALPGGFVPPTIVAGLDEATCTDEVFGPVATMHTFSSDTAALAMANRSPFGLAGYVFGEEKRARALGNLVRAGVIKINGVGLLGLHPLAPRPAWGLSGIGDEGCRETFEFFRGRRVVGTAGRPRRAALA